MKKYFGSMGLAVAALFVLFMGSGEGLPPPQGNKCAEGNVVLTDSTTNNVTSTMHGFAPKAPADANKFLNGAATPAWAYPMMNGTKGADVASAATINLTTATGNWVDVTGSVGIGTVTLGAGNVRLVRFTGTPTITAGSNLILPTSAATIVAASGDCALFAGNASSVVVMTGYQRKDGTALTSSSGKAYATVVVAASGGDYTTLSAAVADATIVASGGTIVVREGTFAGGVTVPASTDIVGMGRGTIITTTGTTAVFTLNETSHHLFADFNVSGDGTANGKIFTTAVSTAASVRNVRSTGVDRVVVVTAGSPEIRFNDCKFVIPDGTTTGLMWSGAGTCRAFNTICWDNATANLGGFGTASSLELYCNDCRFGMHTGLTMGFVRSFGTDFLAASGDTVIFSGNETQVIGGGASSNTTFRFSGTRQQFHAFNAGTSTFTLACTGSHFICSGLYGQTSTSISVTGSSNFAFSNMLIEGGNSINVGLLLSGTADVFISNCQISNYAQDAIAVTNSSVVFVSNCQLIGTNNSINESGTSDNNTYTGNYAPSLKYTIVGVNSRIDGRNSTFVGSNQGGRLQADSTTQISYQRYNGDFVTVGTGTVAIGTLGLTCTTSIHLLASDGTDSGGAPGASTLYRAYVSDAAASFRPSSLSLSATAPSFIASSNCKYLATTGNGSHYRYMGDTYTDGSTHFINSVTQRFVRNEYNQKPVSIFVCPGYVDNNSQDTYTTTSTTYVEVNGGTGSKVEFIADGLSSISYYFTGSAWSSAAGAAVYFGVGEDSATDPAVNTSFDGQGTANRAMPFSTGRSYVPTAGYHYLDALWRVSSSTGNISVDENRGGAAADPPATFITATILQ